MDLCCCLIAKSCGTVYNPWTVTHQAFPSMDLCVCVCVCVCAKSLQSCPTLCDPMDCSLPGSSVHGTLHARIMEWVAVPSSRRSSQPRDQTRVSRLLHWKAGSLPRASPGQPLWFITLFYQITFITEHYTEV